MLAGLDKKGCTITPDSESAKTVVVNTCAFVKDAKVESIDTILEMTARKEEGLIDKVIVTGCSGTAVSRGIGEGNTRGRSFRRNQRSKFGHRNHGWRSGVSVSVSNPDRRNFDWEAPE